MLNEYIWTKFDNQSVHLEGTQIFKVCIPEVTPNISPFYYRLLSKAETEKVNRFRFFADKERFAVSRITLKLLIDAFLGMPLNGVDLEYTKFGKPVYDGLEFNISHSGNFVLIAIGGAPLGIDIETSKEGFDFNSLHKNTFCAKEIAYINDGDDRKTRFIVLWTRKEALLKATGEGLIDDLRSISVLDDNVERNGKTYLLNSFKVNQLDIASIATSNETNILKTYSISKDFYMGYLKNG